MRTLTAVEMESHLGGDLVDGLCVGIGAGSVVYAAGIITNWWNPVGWASATFIVADAACIAYAASQL